MKKNKTKKKFMDRMVILSAAMITALTIVAIVLQFVTGVELSSTLISCWFGFWTVEIFGLVSIKNTNTKAEGKNKASEDASEDDAEG